MSPKNPRRQETSRAPHADARAPRAEIGLALSPGAGRALSTDTCRALSTDTGRARAFSLHLLLPLCLLLAPALAARRAAAQSSQPAPAPTVRPRTVGSKDESARPAAQTERTPTQTERTPAQAGNAGAGQTNRTGAQDANKTAAQDAGKDSQDAEAVGEDDVVRVDSNLVIIPASVVDGRGHAVTDLKVEDFELRVDGEVKQIGDLSRAETPVQVALLFDNSASLSAAREFEKQAAVRFFQSVVRPIDRAAVYSISTNVALAQPLTADVSRLVRTVQNFGKPDGATALFDAVAQASDYMRTLQGRKVLVIVSDGTDTVSDVSFEEAVNRALRAECQVYVVQTHQVEDPNLHDTVSEQRMSKLTEQTGGAVYVPQSVADLDAVFTQISLDISQQYLLGYYPQDERRDNFFRFISVRVKTRPSLRVRARKGFYPASARDGNSPAPAELAGTARFSSPNTSRPEYVASASSRPEYAAGASARPAPAAQRRSSGGGNLARRDDNAARKIGPDGPDDDERPKPPPATSDDTAPTFTLTTVAAPSSAASSMTSSAPPSSSTPSPASSPAPSSSSAPATSAPASTSVAAGLTSAAATPSATPSPSPQPWPAPPRVVTDPAPQPKGAPTPADAHATAAAAEQKAEARPRTPASGGVLNARALSLPRPVYPAAARSAGASGKVVVEVTINEEGKVIEARAVSGHPMLQQAALQAARLAKFSPSTLSGQPVKVTGTISYTFVGQ